MQNQQHKYIYLSMDLAKNNKNIIISQIKWQLLNYILFLHPLLPTRVSSEPILNPKLTQGIINWTVGWLVMELKAIWPICSKHHNTQKQYQPVNLVVT